MAALRWVMGNRRLNRLEQIIIDLFAAAHFQHDIDCNAIAKQDEDYCDCGLQPRLIRLRHSIAEIIKDRAKDLPDEGIEYR